MIRNKQKKERGITLIALVVTIVVLLILAGITITFVLGEGGILDMAKEAADKTKNSIANDQADMTNLANQIENLVGGTTTGNEEDTFVTQVTKDNYGEYVDYEMSIDGDEDTTNDWRIFLEDGENVYLIANDYIKYTTAPGIHRHDGDYGCLVSQDLLDKYTGAQDIDSRLVKWLSYLNSNGSSENPNMKAVAYKLDTSKDVWGKFANSYAEYAIGAPTLDMFCKSYNDKHTPKIEYQVNSNNLGYEVKLSNQTDWSSDNLENAVDTNDNLYCSSEKDEGDTFAMWLASPSCYEGYGDGSCVFRFSMYGIASSHVDDESGIGFRPIVCIKSSVKGKKEGSVWKLQN